MDKYYSNYYGLIFKCPLEKELRSCVFYKIRGLPSKERIAYYNVLTMKEKDLLIENHQICLSIREKKKIFQKTK